MTTRDLNVLNSILNPSIPRSDIPTEKPIEKPTEGAHRLQTLEISYF